MKRSIPILMAAALALSVAACNKVTYVNPTTMPTGQVHEETGRFFILGLAGTKDIHAYQLCPEGVAKVQSRLSFVDLLLTGLTFAIYTPRTYEIHCGRKVQ